LLEAREGEKLTLHARRKTTTGLQPSSLRKERRPTRPGRKEGRKSVRNPYHKMGKEKHGNSMRPPPKKGRKKKGAGPIVGKKKLAKVWGKKKNKIGEEGKRGCQLLRKTEKPPY